MTERETREERLKREATEKIAALAKHFSVPVDKVEASEFDDMWLTVDGEDWEVLTDDEAEERLEDHLDQYIDDCILPELPEAYQCFFHSEKWKDAARMDGRGHCINSYDGEEHHVRINKNDYYLYRRD